LREKRVIRLPPGGKQGKIEKKGKSVCREPILSFRPGRKSTKGKGGGNRHVKVGGKTLRA